MTTPEPGKTSLLFVGSSLSTARMARGLLEAAPGEASLQVACVGLQDYQDSDQAAELMRAAGAELPAGNGALSELKGQTFDLVVTLDDEARRLCLSTTPLDADSSSSSGRSPMLAGIPVLLHWAVESTGGQLEQARDELARRINALMDQGFLEAFLGQRGRWERLLDTLQDGVLAHDVHRKIFLFNREAERICGLKREEVLGRDCHDVFQGGGLCGAQCNAPTEPSFEHAQYETSFTALDGVDRRLKMSVSPIHLEAGKSWGVIVSMQDITEVSDLRHRLRKEHSFHGMVTASARMQELFTATRQICTSDYPVLITGESGTGKELMASAIHQESRRKGGPFVPINCGALPDNILESELFGHVRGAFTGAIRNKKGRFEMAHGGTLFLDEVGELSPSFQVKLLRVLQEKRFEMVGGERTIEVDVRVVAATVRDLSEEVDAGTFREDLYYRLNVLPLSIPPLRERIEDVRALVEHFVECNNARLGMQCEGISPDTLKLLMEYPWPGNVRELENTIEHAMVLAESSIVELESLPEKIRQSSDRIRLTLLSGEMSIKKTTRVVEEELIRRALKKTGGNRTNAAKILEISHRDLLYKIKEYGLSDL